MDADPISSAEAGPARRDAERTRAEILEVAVSEFCEHGFDGTRVDAIAAKTRTTKRMIYYYFSSKEQLYVAALEFVYASIRSAEQEVDVAHLEPVAAIRRIAELTFDHHEAHPDFLRLITMENMHRARHIRQLSSLVSMNTPAVDRIATILERGRASGDFVRKIDAVDVHMLISSFCFFRVANQHTFGALFHRNLTDVALADHYRAMVGDLVVEYLTSDGDRTAPTVALAGPATRGAARRRARR
ncbi:MAG: TetR/AcrR family transcriptional regulator [Actinomycetota bacterium]|nr:TetR/AcrR family transcriptional regulator [Actinomycetota bacterium]